MNSTLRSGSILFLSINMLYAVSCRVDAEEPIQPVAEIRIPSLMESSQALSNLFERTTPGSSGIIAVSVAALSFSPQLGPFDLAQPIHILGFPARKDGKPSFEWGLLLVKRPDADMKKGIKGQKQPVYVKEMGDNAFLTYSKSLSESIGTLSMPEYNDPDFHIQLILHPEKYFSSFPGGLDTFRKEMMRQMVSRKGRADEDFNDLKFMNIRLGAFEDFLRQCKSLDLKLFIHEDNISMKSEFLPIAGSTVEKFLMDQKSGGKAERSANPVDEFESAGRISIDKGLKDSLLSITKSTLDETSDGPSKDIIDLISVLTDKFSGNFTCRMESFDSGSPVCLDFEADGGKRKEIESFLSERKNMFVSENGIFRYRKDGGNSKFNFFISSREEGISIFYGKMDDKYAIKMLSSPKSVKKEGTEANADIRVDAYSKPDKMAPLFSSFFIFGEKKLLLDTNVYIEGVRRIIPPELMQNRQDDNQE